MIGYDLTKAWLKAHDLKPALAKLERYVELVEAENKRQNLTAWAGDKFWLNGIYTSLSALFLAFGKGADLTLADIGSGVGVPALPYLIAFPHVVATLIEPRRKRFNFLLQVCTELMLTNVSVKMMRAEKVANQKFLAVTAQAVAPLNELVNLSYHLGDVGSKFVFFKGANLASEIIAAQDTLRSHQVKYQVLPLNNEWLPEQVLFVFTK